jgi:hypothetical protein
MWKEIGNYMWKIRAWFLRGYGSWVSFLINTIQFVIIVYALVIKDVAGLRAVFPSFWLFILIFCAIGIPTCALIGYVDYGRYGSFRMESNVGILATPFNKDLSKALILICDGKTEEAKKILEKWL